jgi:trans-aconitate methyltransferase
MEPETAIRLIKKAIVASDSPQQWADLGAGNGLFTQALATRLSPKSSILAVDRNESALKSIILQNPNVTLHLQSGDFTAVNLANEYNGFLLANALHYIQNATVFLTKLKSGLSSSGRLVIVEYDRRESNPWVPYPVPFEKLKQVGHEAGFTSIKKLEEVPSVYDSVSIYSAVLTLN